MKKRVIKLTENQLNNIVKSVLNEGYVNLVGPSDDICEIVCKRKVAAKGSTGDIVKMIQHLLSVNKYNPKYSGGGMTGDWCYTDWRRCDGIFKGHTEDAVKELQAALGEKYGLVVDGIVGYRTWYAMCTTLQFTKSLSKNKFCVDCQCKQKRDDGKDSDLIFDPIQPIRDVDCDVLKDCVDKYLYTTTPNVDEFQKCAQIKSVGDGKVFSCSLCKSSFPTGYVDKMPKSVVGSEKQMTDLLGDWCLKKCDGYKKAY